MPLLERPAAFVGGKEGVVGFSWGGGGSGLERSMGEDLRDSEAKGLWLRSLLVGVWVCERGVNVTGGSIALSGGEATVRGEDVDIDIVEAGPILTGEMERARSAYSQYNWQTEKNGGY